MSPNEKPPPNVESIYPSKVDWWVYCLIAIVPLIHLPLGIWIIAQTGSTLIGVLLIVWGLIMGVIMLGMLWPCRYHLESHKLTIRSGMVVDPIGLSQVESITPLRSWLPAPALSVDRVELILADGSKRQISPKNLDAFVQSVRAAITKQN